VKADDHTEANGTRVQGTCSDGVQTKLGLRAYMNGKGAQDKCTAREFEPFVEANWLHITENDGMRMNGTESHVTGTRNAGELKAGADGGAERKPVGGAADGRKGLQRHGRHAGHEGQLLTEAASTGRCGTLFTGDIIMRHENRQRLKGFCRIKTASGNMLFFLQCYLTPSLIRKAFLRLHYPTDIIARCVLTRKKGLCTRSTGLIFIEFFSIL
jgi:hypothetical protein